MSTVQNLLSPLGKCWSCLDREFQCYLEEEKSSWTQVSGNNRLKDRSYAEVVRKNTPLTGANSIPIQSGHFQWQKKSVFNRIDWGRKSMFDRIQPSAKNKDIPVQNSNGLLANSWPARQPCRRCLFLGHQAFRCWRPIKCRVCYLSGHIAANCSRSEKNLEFTPKQPVTEFFKKSLPVDDVSNWFKRPQSMSNGASSSGLPVFNSFRNFSGAILGPISEQKDSPSENCTESAPRQNFGFNPNTQLALSTPELVFSPQPHGGALESSMAFQRYDPQPFLSTGFDRVAVLHRDPAVRAVVVRPRYPVDCSSFYWSSSTCADQRDSTLPPRTSICSFWVCAW